MKRFWKTAELAETDGGWSIMLDGRPLKTPARETLSVPHRALAEAILAEWRDCREEIDPRAMPMTGLANAAIDHVAPDPARFAADLARYAEGDLFCYRAEAPPSLAALQAASWDPLLAWARRRFDVDFVVTSGLLHVPQPAATVERLSHALTALDPFLLAAMAPLTTIGGSLVAALAVEQHADEPAAAWHAVSVDERWELEKWGADAEAEAAMDAHRRDFLAAARFLSLLDQER